MNYVLLAAATAILPLANGRFSVAIVAWIAPAVLVRFMRTSSGKEAFFGGVIALSIANYVWWLEVFPLSGFAYVLTSIVAGLISVVPYLLDRRYRNVFILPSAIVTLELLHSLGSPFGSWGSFAYSQAANLPVMQIASITGLAGITFLIFWFATALNGTRRELIACLCALGAVVIFGGARLLSSDTSDSVRMAMVTPRVPTYVRGLEAIKRADAINTELLTASANAGAKLVLWSEGAGIVEKKNEAALLARASAVAGRNRVWIAMSYLVLDGSKTYENKNVLVDDAGKIVWTYHKAHPVPGMEMCAPGDGRIPMTDTPFGRIAAVICFDGDFPRFIRKAAGADMLLLPSDDWRAAARLHASMAKFRAVEQGFALVRSTSNGYSMIVDRYGRVLQDADYFASVRVLTAAAPRDGAATVYERIGDTFAYAVAALFLVLLVAPQTRRAILPNIEPAAMYSSADGSSSRS